LVERPGEVVAVLDETMAAAGVEEGGVLRANWLERREPFDFDAVQIANATDAEVERFAMAVGNDMDEVRRERYALLRCEVAPECRLSEHTLRVLRSTFGEVVVKDHAA